MSKSDFFSFITSLKPIELKAIGELSQVVHLEEGITVYNRGDVSDALYIINRGALEVMHEANGNAGNTSVSYLSRGDVFGETEVLSDVPRKKRRAHLRVGEHPAFHQEELSRTDPPRPGILFLSQPADRLAGHEDDRPCLRPEQLPGTQWQPGEFRPGHDLSDDPQFGADRRPLGGQRGKGNQRHLFVQGRPGTVRDVLSSHRGRGLLAVAVARKTRRYVSFSIVEHADKASAGPLIRRNPTDLLITALQYRDEFKGLCEEIPDPASVVRRERLNLEWSDPEFADLRPVAESIWQLCYSSAMTLDELCLELPVCELKFYKTVLQLVRTGHFSVEADSLRVSMGGVGGKPGGKTARVKIGGVPICRITGSYVGKYLSCRPFHPQKHYKPGN